MEKIGIFKLSFAIKGRAMLYQWRLDLNNFISKQKFNAELCAFRLSRSYF
jgi:hypothetical protein